MTLTAFFQYRLAIAQQKGYARCVSFNIDPSLAGASAAGTSFKGCAVTPRAASGEAAGHFHDDSRPLKRRFVSGPGMAMRRYNTKKQAKRRSPAFFQQAKAQLILWPTVKDS